MNPNTTHRAWHPGEDDDYMRAAIDRVRERCGMSDLRDGIAAQIDTAMHVAVEVKDEPPAVVRREWQDSKDITVEAILALVRDALLNPAVVREGARGIHVSNGYDADRLEKAPDFLTEGDVSDAEAAITAALDAAGMGGMA